MTWIMYAVLPTLIDVIIVKHKRNKTIKKIKASLNEKGYIVDKRMEKDIVERIIVDYEKEKYEDTAWYIDKAFSFTPIIRWMLLPSSIRYLCGDYSGDNNSYWCYEDIVDDDEKVISFLEERGYITVDEEKMQWINDRDNALKDLEKKYDNDIENENKDRKNAIEIRENDNLEMLKLKRKWLDEMIELKTKLQKGNDNISAEEIKKENSNVELDNLSLKYKR